MTQGAMTVNELAFRLANHLRGLEPGDLAQMRRMGVDGAPGLWRLAAKYEQIGSNMDQWRAIARILAILTPKGRVETRPEIAKEAVIPLGRALCTGGDPAWRPEGDPPRGVVSEDRLARFLATRGPARVIALERLARTLARRLPPDAQISPADIAWAILAPADPKNRIARDYYKSLDSRFSDKDNADE